MTTAFDRTPLSVLHLTPATGGRPALHFQASHSLAFAVTLRSTTDLAAPPHVATLSIDTHPAAPDDANPLAPALDILRKVAALGPCRLEGWFTADSTVQKVTLPRVDWSETAVLYAELIHDHDESLGADTPAVIRLSLQRGDPRPAVDDRYFTVAPDITASREVTT
ncbi:hypothetical protein [Streptomyces californicus]|uniref:hypothetical protein n=1 Tax=Streptomyces californicus TaxID=67351 RepID=UPI0037FC86C2